MQLTQEQELIIQSQQNICINAVAGSGKTTTIVAYAKTRPLNSKILYLAFNKAVKLEAIKKFSEAGLTNVVVETAHSLAYKHIVFNYQYEVKNKEYSTHELVNLLQINVAFEKHGNQIIANHVKKWAAMFCNSDCQKVQELNYLSTIADENAYQIVQGYYTDIQQYTRLFLSMMNNGTISVTHDFYLKKFQLASFLLAYDYILFDEAQDASPVMVSWLMQQKATKVIVGDVHQQIYGWRYAVNAMNKFPFKQYHLTNSFRFGSSVALLATAVLEWKHKWQTTNPIQITGINTTSTKVASKAVVARTNLGLLLKAIEWVIIKKKVTYIYFEGNLSSYVYAEEGASLYDVLNLQEGKKHLIKDAIIKEMASIGDLEEYIEQTEDTQMGMMLEIVKEYGNRIPELIKTLKEKHVLDGDKMKADVVFTTVHRCKGLEYDEVHLADDFINEAKMEKLMNEAERSKQDFSNRVVEEINLLYVAVTRAKKHLYIPEVLLPTNYLPGHGIFIVKDTKADAVRTPVIAHKLMSNTSCVDAQSKKGFQKIREVHKSAYFGWNEDMDKQLKKSFKKGIAIKDIAQSFGRTNGAIYARVKKLGLVSE